MRKLIFALMFLPMCAVAQGYVPPPEKLEKICLSKNSDSYCHGVDDLLGKWYALERCCHDWTPNDSPGLIVTRDGDAFVFDHVSRGDKYTCKNPELYDDYKLSEYHSLSGIIFECDFYREYNDSNTRVYLEVYLSKSPKPDHGHPVAVEHSALALSFYEQRDKNCFFNNTDKKCKILGSYFFDPYR